MKNTRPHPSAGLILILGFVTALSGSAPPEAAFPGYESLVKNLMKENGIEGAAAVLFDGTNVIWSGAFGRMGGDDGRPVTMQTIFSIQSMSKTVAAAAVLVAAQDGLLDLDRPVTEYLPGFTINSCFETDPGKKITLRLLLGCAAGLTHEAPVGNNYDASFPSFDEHCRSIGDTWLRSPVGTQYFYSNLGFDLAARIIEKVSGMTYPEYLEAKIFRPLGMTCATADPKKILESRNRASGSMAHFAKIPVIVPMMGAGGIYASAEDMAAFVQMHLALGEFRGKRLLEKERLIEMERPFISESYALGLAIVDEGGTYAFNHNGGGFGFGSTMKWYPEYGVGCVILTNRLFQSNVYETASKILDDWIRNHPQKKDTLMLFNPVAYWKHFAGTVSAAQTASMKCPGDSAYRPEWAKHTGTYLFRMAGGNEFAWYAKIARLFGFKMPKVKVYEKDGALYLNCTDGSSWQGGQKLTEYKQGLFFTAEGEALDFRSIVKTYRNVALE
jgi:CubicO group peptidase (beta-lactamase class C family)